MTKLIFFVLIIVAAALEVLADAFFKEWSLKNKNVLFGIGMAIYLLATIIWAFSIKYELLSKAICVFALLNIIIVVLVGVLYFKEQLTLLNKIGVLLGIISVILVEI